MVKIRRSCRSFCDSTFSEGRLLDILDAGRWAPSPLNLQPWEFIIIQDPEIKSQVRKVAESAKQEVIDQNGPRWAAGYSIDFLEEAAVLIVVVVNPDRGGLGSFFGQKYGAIQAASACIQNMLLACAEMRLGALWFTFFRPENLRAVLDIPAELEIAGVLPIGKTSGSIKRITRKEPKIHYNCYTKPGN
ncbi:MAG: nitroreductase family protein [Bacteroidales bacterium]|nr:nitroreductase family protein [Bacteroidales bacterium]